MPINSCCACCRSTVPTSSRRSRTREPLPAAPRGTTPTCRTAARRAWIRPWRRGTNRKQEERAFVRIVDALKPAAALCYDAAVKIAIVGAGGVGGYFGGRVLAAGAGVRFLARRAPLDALRATCPRLASPESNVQLPRV